MSPLYDSQNAMDMPLYQQLQLTSPSPKPDQSFYYPYYPSPSCFAAEGLVAVDVPPAAPMPPVEQLAVAGHEHPPAGMADGTEQGIASERAAAVARKDRHSKICTAGGMRDRRMRLSLDVARKFFALQDMLGFDKASKTVQWLLNMSRAAIRELVSNASASSECEEDGSSLSDGGKHRPVEIGGGQKGGGGEGRKAKPKRAAAPKAPRKSNAHPVIPDKDSRAKARERARERTREKNRLRWATLASSIAVDAAARGEPSSRQLIDRWSANMVSELEERCSSSLNNEGWHGRMQEYSTAHETGDGVATFNYGIGIPVIGDGAYSNCHEQWELGGVVFGNSKFY